MKPPLYFNELRRRAISECHVYHINRLAFNLFKAYRPVANKSAEMGGNSSKGSFTPSSATYESEVVDVIASVSENFSVEILVGSWLESDTEELASDAIHEDHQGQAYDVTRLEVCKETESKYKLFVCSL